MRFRVEVIEVVTSIREVEADDYKHLKEKVREDGMYVGRSVKQHFQESMKYEITDDSGRAYPTINEI